MSKSLWLCLFLLVGCAENPVTGKLDFVVITEEEELQMGRLSDEAFKQKYGVYPDAELQRYVNAVGQRLAKNSQRSQIEYHFTVLDTPLVNAFALPGGYVYVTRGILAMLNSEDELAAVIGHEIGHDAARHIVRQFSSSETMVLGSLFVPGMGSKIGQSLVDSMSKSLFSGYSREYELEADRLSAQYLTKSGYRPEAMMRIIEALQAYEMFEADLAKKEGRAAAAYHAMQDTHPDNDIRFKQLVGATRESQTAAPNRDADTFMSRIAGLYFGKNADHGAIRDHTFYHAAYGLALDFPPGWHAAALPDLFVAQSPERAVLLTLNRLNVSHGSAPDLLRKLLRLDAAAPLQPLSLNGFASAIAAGGAKDIFAVVKPAADQAYVVAARAESAAALAQYLESVNLSLNSVRPLNAQEQRYARPRRIKTISAGNGVTYAELARDALLGDNTENILRLLNGAYPNGELSPGQTLKIIE